MKILSAEQTAAVLPYPALVDAMEQLFRDGVTVPQRHHHTLPKDNEPDSTLLLMPAWHDTYGCVKIATVTPGNAQRGLPAVTASVLVFDNQTGEHIALLDGATVTARRTAAASALAAQYLAPADARTLLVVGAGRVGSELPAAFAAVRPIDKVMVWNPSVARGEQLVARLQQQGVNAEWRHDLESAVSQADIISCATLATEPVIRGEWLRPGQHLDLIGSFTPVMREVDDEALQRSQLYVDIMGTLKESGELAIPLASGAIPQDHVLGTLYDLCGSSLLERDPAAITCFKGAGNAVMDLAAALLAMEAAN